MLNEFTCPRWRTWSSSGWRQIWLSSWSEAHLTVDVVAAGIERSAAWAGHRQTALRFFLDLNIWKRLNQLNHLIVFAKLKRCSNKVKVRNVHKLYFSLYIALKNDCLVDHFQPPFQPDFENKWNRKTFLYYFVC